MNSTQSVFSILDSGDDDESKAVLVQGLAEHSLQENALDVKMKLFKSASKPATTGKATHDTGSKVLSAKDMWAKYMDPIDTSYLDNIVAASGIRYTTETCGILLYMMDMNQFPQKLWESLFLRIVEVGGIEKQVAESIELVCGCYELAGNASKVVVTTGTKTVGNLFTHALKTDNPKALNIMMDYLLECEAAGTAATLNPNEPERDFETTIVSITENQLVNIGGPNFSGVQKEFYSVPLKDTKTYAATLASMKVARKGVVAVPVDSIHPADLNYVPKFEDLQCEWTLEPTQAGSMALEMAYKKGYPSAFDLLLKCAAVRNYSGELFLTSSMLGLPIPESITLMQQLTSLTIKMPSLDGPVPSEIFQLVSLKKLVLSGCGFDALSDEIAQLVNLESLYLSDMPNLTSLPLMSMGRMEKLDFVECIGLKVNSIPSEIMLMGPQAVAQYIHTLGEGAETNHDVLLMLIGDGEAGKTSMLQALKNTETDCAREIGVDERTVGIDISSFQPLPAEPLRFFAWDFGGQGIYAIMQQLFVSRRALYPLLWRVRQSLDVTQLDHSLKCDVCKKHLVAQGVDDPQQPVYRVKGQGLCHAKCVSYEPMITSWTERLQFRVPGVSMVLIATHIDCASAEEVDEQCAAVASVVERLLARQVQTMPNVPPLRIYNNGQSLRVNNMNGEGVQALRNTLCEIAKGLDFYGEMVPASYVRLKQKLREMQHHGEPTWRTWLHWDDYAALAAECGLSDAGTLKQATKFFHDVGELRYFGDNEVAASSLADNKELPIDYDSDGDPVPAPSQKLPTKQPAGSGADALLTKTVFPNPFWIVDVLRSLIRHDHSTVLDLVKHDAALSTKERRTLRRRVYRLMQRGILHASLLQYVWHGVAGLSESADSNTDEFQRLLALMKAFNILMDKPGEALGSEWIVPTLSAGKHSHTIESQAFVDDSLPFVCRLVYDALPPYFDMILVAHIMNSRIADSVDFIEGAAAFHQLANRALLFAGLGKVRDPRSVFRQDQLCEEHLRTVLREDQCHVVIAASCRKLMIQLIDEVSNLEAFFPGLRRLTALFPCYSCRAKQTARKQAVAKDPSALAAMQEGVARWEVAEADDAVQLQKLPPVADDLSGAAWYFTYRASIDSALAALAETDLKNVLGLSADGAMCINIDKTCQLSTVYCAGYDVPPPRFHQEVLMLMMELKSAMDPSPEDALRFSSDEHSQAIEVCRSAVAERKFVTAFQQAGAELPSHRTVQKFCTKHADTLFAAWELCPELEILCMGFNSAVQESAPTDAMVANQDVATLPREDAVPEYMHLLRSVVELMTAHQRPPSSQKDRQDHLEAYRMLLTERTDDLAVLYRHHPELQLMSLDGSGEANTENFLVKAYGAGTAHCQEQHHLALTAALAEFDAQCVQEPCPAQLPATGAEQDLHPGPSMEAPSRSYEPRANVLQTFFPDAFAEIHRAFSELQGDLDSPAEYSSARRYDLLFSEAVIAYIYAQYALRTDETMARVAGLDTSGATAGASSISDAYREYVERNMRFMPLIKGALTEQNHHTWKKIFGEKGTVLNTQGVVALELPAEFTTACAKMEMAQRLLLIVLHVEAVKRILAEQADLLAEFDITIPDIEMPVEMDGSWFQEFEELWELHRYLNGRMWDADPALSRFAVADSDKKIGDVCCNYAESDNFLFDESSSVPFFDVSVAYTFMESIYSALREHNECFREYVQLQYNMSAWERSFPINAALKAEASDEHEVISKPENVSLGLKIALINRPLCIFLLESFQRMQESRDGTALQEILRTVTYLTDPQRDVNQLLPIVRQRMDDILARKVLVDKMLGNVDSIMATSALTSEWSKGAVRLRALKERFPEFTFWSDEWSQLQAFQEHVAEGIQRIVNDAKQKLVNVFRQCAWKDRMWVAASAKIENIVLQARDQAQAWSERHVKSVAGLLEGPLPAALKDMVTQMKVGIKVYASLREATAKAPKARVLSAAQAASTRAAAYAALTQLRAIHAPPWHCGCGRRVRNKKLKDYSSLKVQQLKPEVWKSDWKAFVEGDGHDSILHQCPAETEATESMIQPAERPNVLISSTEAGYAWAESISKCLSSIEGMHGHFHATEPRQVLRGSGWVYFTTEEASDEPPKLGFFSERMFRYMDDYLYYEENGAVASRSMTGVSYAPVPEFMPWARKKWALEGQSVLVDVNCDGRWRRGIVIDKPEDAFDAAKLYVQADDSEIAQYYPVSGVKSTVPAGFLERYWLQALQFRAGARVLVPSNVTDGHVLGTICEEVVKVHFEDGAEGVFPLQLVEPVDVAKEVALAAGKVMICCIDSNFGSNPECIANLQKAKERGMGIIPVILPGYAISNYLEWWPEQMPALRQHSLFIDMRAATREEGVETQVVNDVCSKCIAPTLRVLLSEWKDPSHLSQTTTSDSATAVDQHAVSSGVGSADAPGSGDHFVFCELCSMESVNLGSSPTGGPAANELSKPGPATFDRWKCQKLVVDWTMEELQRREQHPDQPSVLVCPISVRCSGPEGHEKLARDVLTIKEKKTSYPCPQCITKGILPPHCFDREVCLAELEYQSGGSILCKRCHQATPLHELLTCEVFLSYCWGSPQCPTCTVGVSAFESKHLRRDGLCEACGVTHQDSSSWKYSTQRVVTELKGAVEPEAGVMCWQDVDRLVGGKDLEREMEVGVKQADVIVIFLDDGYVRSHNCRREYLHATKHGKYIIPILLHGYTGAASATATALDKWWPESMSSLAQFQPIILTEASQMESVLFEVCERIQSRFHRAQRFPTADDAIAYLRDYSSWGVTRKAFLADHLTLERQDEVDAHLQRVFQKMDRDGNNMVDEAELTAFLDESNLCLSSEQISTLIMEADIDHNGCLSLEELKLAIAAMLDKQGRSKTV